MADDDYSLWDKFEQFKERHNRRAEATGDPLIVEWIGPGEPVTLASFFGKTPPPIPAEPIRKAYIDAHYKALQDYCRDILPVARRGDGFSQGGTHKKGRIFEPKSSLKAVCEHIGSLEFDAVLDALRDADLCGDLFHSTKYPIGVEFVGVDDAEEVISYLKRGDSPNNPRKLKFSTLRNHMTSIKQTAE